MKSIDCFIPISHCMSNLSIFNIIYLNCIFVYDFNNCNHNENFSGVIVTYDFLNYKTAKTIKTKVTNRDAYKYIKE